MDNKSGSAEIVIFYFSGTGNTWWASNEMVRQFEKLGRPARAFSIEVLSINEAIELIQDSDIVGFGYPIHGSDLPVPMKNFIEQLPAVSGEKAFVFLPSGYGLVMEQQWEALCFMIRALMSSGGSIS